MASIGLRILELIRDRGMTQKEFSDRTGIPQSTISDWRGKRLNPNADKILIICDTLNISPQDLLSGEKSEKSRKSRKRRAADAADSDAESERRETTNVDYICIDKGTPEYEIILKYRSLQPDDKRRLEGYLRAQVDMSDG